MINLILAVVFAYLLGSIPTAVWVGKIFYNIDVRDHGSGNAGATNTFRVLGKTAGIPVLCVDILKGVLAVSLANRVPLPVDAPFDTVTFQIFLGLAALLGHIFPIYAKFKGGKGIATLLGIMLGIIPIPTLICLGVFVLVFVLSKYVSLGSIIASILLPILLIFIIPTPLSMQIFGVAVAIMVVVTHRKNIKRLINNEENKMVLGKKK